MMCMHGKLRCAKFVLLAVLGIAALGWLVMALWNWLVPAVFVGAREVDYWQAMGVLLLSRILFGGFRGHGGHWHRHYARWEQMSPEEREKLQAAMGNCGKAGGTEGSDVRQQPRD